MPNLLKSLPREILEKEDSKFIYNVLNPLLFDKIKESDDDTTVTHSVSSLLNKDLHYSKQFLSEFRLPYNINSREFHVYITDGQEKVKIEHFGDTNLVKELENLKEYIFFYLSVDGYEFLFELMRQYNNIKNLYDDNKDHYEKNYKKYIAEPDLGKKKIYKSSYEFFKKAYEQYANLKTEFDLILAESFQYASYSAKQLVDNYATVIGDNLKIKTFDNDIIFSKSVLFNYLQRTIVFKPIVNKHVFSGKNIVSTTSYNVHNVFELIALFAMEISTINAKYTEYLEILNDHGQGFSLFRSDNKVVKNEIYENVSINLDSDNLTYNLDENKNKLDIYVYFLKNFKIDTTTFKLTINNIEIPVSVHSLKGTLTYGYTMFEYFDSETKYYKITVHDYLVYDLNGVCLNQIIDTLDLKCSMVKETHTLLTSSAGLHLETTGFIDNFSLYRKNKQSGFFELFEVPYKLKVSIDEKEERYVRSYEFIGINNAAQKALIDDYDIILSCCDYDYVYEPTLYVDFFKYMSYSVNFRFNTILPYVLIDDVMDEDFEIPYYSEISLIEYSTNIHKNIIMYDGVTYRKLFDDINHMRLLNPYNESNYEYVSRISYSTYLTRQHTNPVLVDSAIAKIPFRNNLRMLEKLQYDAERNMIVFMHMGVQKVVPVNEEGLQRGLNYEKLSYNLPTNSMQYCGHDLYQDGFLYLLDGIYLKNPLTGELDIIEATPTEQINLSIRENEIFFDVHEMAHCILLNNRKYKVSGIYVDTYINALKNKGSVIFIESKYGIPRYKSLAGHIFDIDFSKKISTLETYSHDTFWYDSVNGVLAFRHNATETYSLPLVLVEIKTQKHRQLGLSAFSIFYSGNVLPENSNKTFFGRENIYGSMTIPDSIYSIGRVGDNYNDTQHHALLSEEFDLSFKDSEKFNMEHEPYLMYKSKSASMKGLESYLLSSLKAISKKVKVSPVYLIQRNRYISEWARVSSVEPDSFYGGDSLKDLVADLMETKLINSNYDDLMDIFKNNEYEHFSIDTNDIHGILVQYILRFLKSEALLEDYTYYLIHNVWINNNRKKIIDFIRNNGSKNDIRTVSELTFTTNYDKEKLFYIFVNTLFKVQNVIIESYIPLSNYSDWELYIENNDVHFNKPYKYEVIDISDFITMAVYWDKPLYMIRPLTEDEVFVKRDFRFLDMSIATNSQITYFDSYNEYVDEIKNRIDKTVSFLSETMNVLNDSSVVHGYDVMGINLVIVRWLVERFLPTYMTHNVVETVEEFREIIKTELNSVEHPNLLVSYNRIKETVFLGDLGSSVSEIIDTIITGNLVMNSTTKLNISSSTELAYLDKIKKPVEHYFDYLFYAKRHDLVTKILALFTEDVIATSMLDLSLAINLKNAKGDKTFDIYEQMIYDIFDEFLPFHSVLDKIIFTFNILEGQSAGAGGNADGSTDGESSDAMGKEVATNLLDTHFIDIVTDFIEKIKIQTSDTSMFSTSMYIRSEGMSGYILHDDMPYDYDRTVLVGGHDIPMHMDDYETFGVDDEWYVINKDRYRNRVNDLYTPPYFAEFTYDDSPVEKSVSTTITEYYNIKTDIFNKDDRILSYFIDTIPVIDIMQGVNESHSIDVIEDYLIHIESVYKINFFDMDSILHDEFGVDDFSGPDSQISLIGMYDRMKQNILHDFYDKINISVIDSIWTDVVVVYNLDGIPGHDTFGIDEYYHQLSPNLLEQEISTMVYDKLMTTTMDLNFVDMSDVSLIDTNIATQVFIDYRGFLLNTVVADVYHINIDICTTRIFDSEGHFLRMGHDEFVYDENYHNSSYLDRMEHSVDILVEDFVGLVKIDFGFMRMLPFDPYEQLIQQKFYRANLPGSEIQASIIRDKFTADIHSFSKDIIRIGLIDFYTLDFIAEDLRRKIYDDIEKESFGDSYVESSIIDSIFHRHVHFDFREYIIAIDKYTYIPNDTDILEIYGVRAADIERDKLFKIEFSEKYYTNIKLKQDVERSMTKIDKDYLKSIKVEEENFVQFKYVENEIGVKFHEMLGNHFYFSNRLNVKLTDIDKILVKQISKDTSIKSEILDKVHYGHMYDFEIDGMLIAGSDNLIEMWTNKIYNDSMVVTMTDSYKTEITVNNIFGKERVEQLHDLYGHMGYTDESIDRLVDLKLSDSLIQLSRESRLYKLDATTYDGLMHDVHQHYGDFIDVIIGDSLHTYVHIVKKPWIFPEFDMFGHNEYPHMYNGDSDEFNVTTQLRDSIKQDTYVSLYDANTLVRLFEKINIGYMNYVSEIDSISVSMTDDLKVVDVVTTTADTISLTFGDLIKDDRLFKEHITVTISDKVWYGYKMRDNWVDISTYDTVRYDYSENDLMKDKLPTSVRDWLLVEYMFIDDKPNIRLSDSVSYSEFGITSRDYGLVALHDTLEYQELDVFKLFETSKVYITDKLLIGDKKYDEEISVDFFWKDNISASIHAKKFGYGPGKKLSDTIASVFLDNRLYMDDKPTTAVLPVVDTTFSEDFGVNIIHKIFRDNVGIDTYERMKFGPIFLDKTNVLTNEMFDFRQLWLYGRMGVDTIYHDVGELEFPADSSNQSFDIHSKDDIKLIDIHRLYGESLIILSSDELSIDDKKLKNTNIMTETDKFDGIVLRSTDTLIYGEGVYKYIWDAKQWDRHGYYATYEEWVGHIPHDDFPYDSMAHSDQGDDLSLVYTGISESLLYRLDFTFKDVLSISTAENKWFGEFEADLIFKDYITVLVNDKLKISWDYNQFTDDSMESTTSGYAEYEFGVDEKSYDRLVWLNDRYGVDSIPHNDDAMEYYNGSMDRSITTSMNDIMIVDIHRTFGESLIVLTSNQLEMIENETSNVDGVVISSHDKLMYGIGTYMHIWDAKEWNNHGYLVPYEKWVGHIPHDDIPYGDMEHSDQGDLSQIITGITENLFYDLNFIFKDVLTVVTNDNKGFNFWGYQSVFRDNVGVYTDSRMQVRLENRTDPNASKILRTDSMTISYDFDDPTKSHIKSKIDSQSFGNVLEGNDQHYYRGDEFNAVLADDIKIIDFTHTFKDSLTILTSNQLDTYEMVKQYPDGIAITNNDSIKYCSVGMYDYVWDAKEWEKHGYEIPYENWVGQIPHDEIPYDAMGHGEQGNDLSQVITDIIENVTYNFNFNFKDTLTTHTVDGKWFTQTIHRDIFEDYSVVYANEKIRIGWNNLNYDRFELNTMSVGEISYDCGNPDIAHERVMWLRGRYGVDSIPHDDGELEYYNNSANRSFEALMFDDIKLIDIHRKFTESLTVFTDNQLETVGGGFALTNDYIGLSSNDNLVYGEGKEFLLWDAKEWEAHGYSVPYEHWRGHIPHDDSPLDATEHSDQGDDLSQVVTGVVENINYKFDFKFKDAIIVLPTDEKWYQIVECRSVFKDYAVIHYADRFKISWGVETTTMSKMIIDYNYGDFINSIEHFMWLNDRYGVDENLSGSDELEYYNDSASRSLDTIMNDSVSLIDVHQNFGESLIIKSSDQVKYGFEVDSKSDGIYLVSNDSLIYGEGKYDYIWDAKEWERHGYHALYEQWHGHIPHDEFPYDEMAHSDQGDDLSQVSTGLYESVLYGFDFIFKETLSVDTDDNSFFDYYQYQSIFKEKILIYANDEVIIGLSNTEPPMDLNITDDIKLIDMHFKFTDYLVILPVDKLYANDNINGTNFETTMLLDTISIGSTDKLQYGIGVYDHVWDAKEWNRHGYLVPYENWVGNIPHDEIPYDEMEHNTQGSISQISTGISESLLSHLDFKFKDTINIQLIDDDLKGMIECHSIFKHYVAVYVGNKLRIEWNTEYGLVDVINPEHDLWDYNDTFTAVTWKTSRYGIDSVEHNEFGMEYFDDSIDASISSSIVDDMKIIDIHQTFNESLIILSSDQFKTESSSVDKEHNDGIVLRATDTLTYGVGLYHYVWDMKIWDSHGYTASYERWVGHVPHDEFPYDEMEHSDQGDLAQINLGISDNLLYGFNFSFKDSLVVSTNDNKLRINDNNDGTKVFSVDRLKQYGTSVYDYVWDAKSWKESGYNATNDSWIGHIPHDDFPYDSMQHAVQGDDVSQVSTGVIDTVSYILNFVFKDTLKIQTTDGKWFTTNDFDTIFKDYVTTLVNDRIRITWYDDYDTNLSEISVAYDSRDSTKAHYKMLWLNDRYANDSIPHNDLEMGYYHGSYDRSLSSMLDDGIRVLDIHLTFGESLTILPSDKMVSNLKPFNDKDGIVIGSFDTLLYGEGKYDYIWDAKEWDVHGYTAGYESWIGKIPHDEFPYDDMAHDQQGDLSQITTGMSEHFMYRIDTVINDIKLIYNPHDEFPHDELRHSDQDNDPSSIVAGVVDNLTYGYRKVFKDSLNISMVDSNSFDMFRRRAFFKDKTYITTVEHLKIGWDGLSETYVTINQSNAENLMWLVERNESLIHNDGPLGYYNDSYMLSLDTYIYDDVKMIDINYKFTESLTVITTDKIVSGTHNMVSDIVSNASKNEHILVSNKDNLLYGIGIYDYIWDAKTWDKHGYLTSYEQWKGHIPHGDFPYDEMEHSDQGDDLSQIFTGINDRMEYEIGYSFKDLIKVSIHDDKLLNKFRCRQFLRGKTLVYATNVVKVETDEILKHKIKPDFINEFLNITSNYDTTTKSYRMSIVNDLVTKEEINIRHSTTKQLIDTILRYRTYESIDESINSNLFNSVLFKFDEEFSLINKNKTKIDLYRSDDSGRVTRSMTLIKDQTSAHIEMLFSDVMRSTLKDKVYVVEMS
jgi:hypothetical protein